MKLTIQMGLERSTKGTHVYTDHTPNSPCKTLYIKKGGLPTTPPTNITVTLEAE